MARPTRPFVVSTALLVLALAAPEAAAFGAGAPGTPTAAPTPSPTPEPVLPLTPDPTPSPSPSPSAAPPQEQPVRTTEQVGDPDPRRLPDLTLARVGDLRLIRTSSGLLQLRFSSTLINAGSGPMVVRATRKRPKDDFDVAQRIRTLDGRRPFRTIPVGTVYAGDGHAHWHIRDVVRYTLSPLGQEAGSKPKRRAQKVGFCLYDNERRASRPGQPSRPEFLRDGCGHERDTNTLRMGLSAGWGDKYAWTLLGQFVSLTGIPAGDYRLIGEANPEDAFFEQRTDNNTVFTDIRLRRDQGRASIRILRQGGRPPGEPATAESVELGAGASAPRGVEYPLRLSTPGPVTPSATTRSRKGSSPA